MKTLFRNTKSTGYWWEMGSAVVGIAVGSVLVIAGIPWIESLLVGLGTFLFFEFLYLSNNFRIIIQQNKSIMEAFESLKLSDSFSELQLVYGLRKLKNLISEGVCVQREDILEFWQDCIAKIQFKGRMFSYALPDETWNLRWGEDTSVRIQKERCDAGCSLARIFIMDSAKSELEGLKNTLRQHSRIGINVGCVEKKWLLKNETIRERIRTIGSIDFVIVDESWVCLIFLDSSRKLQTACATRNQKIVKSASFVFDEAKKIIDENKYNNKYTKKSR